jgi:hypothetical protein
MIDISKIEKLVSRYMVNHFVIGYFALFIIYDDSFITKNLLFQVTMAIVASYLLFTPARLIIRLEYGESEDDYCYCNENKKRLIFKFYHLRIFFALAFLAGFYFLTKKSILVLAILFSFILILAVFYFLCEMNKLCTVILSSIMLILILITWRYSLPEKFILNSVILFFIIFISDCFAYNFTKCTHEPGVNNWIINKLIQKFDP